MSDEIKNGAPVEKTRRAIVTTAAQVAVTAPAVGLILSATTQPAAAALYGTATGNAADDPNHNEDIDALELGTNFSNFNGSPMVDDVFIAPPG